MAISKDSITEVLTRADIVTEIGSRMELKKAGGNYIGLCPFHGEKSPSFSVSPSKQFYHCFGCGKNGDAIKFLQEHDGMSFQDAVKDLGERLGVKVEEDQDEQSIRRAQEQRRAAATLEDLCDMAAQFYHRSLHATPDALEYARSRGLSEDILQLYGVGFAGNSRKPLASAFPDYSTSQGLVSAGLVMLDEERDDRFDRFRDRLMFPIRDSRGRVIGFGGRIINDNAPKAPKYLNSPETQLFHKHKVLYGLHEARSAITREKTAYVVEGYMDVVMMAQNGILNAVADMGTAFTEDQARILMRFTDRVCFIFDGDKAGKAAAWKSLKVVLPLLEPRHSFSFLTLPDDLDPDEYLKANSKESFQLLANSAPTLSQYMLDSLMATYGREGKLPSAEAKTQFSVAAEELCALIPQGNPLATMMLQEVDTLVGRAPRATVAPKPSLSPADRLRAASQQSNFSGAQAYDSPRRQWQPGQQREGWKDRPQGFNSAGRNSYGASFQIQPTTAPKLANKTTWQHIIDAISIAPQKAFALGPSIIAMLDSESPEEAQLIGMLEQCGDMPNNENRYAPDQLQTARDLLDNAQKIILKQRIAEVSSELKKMHDDGQITEDEYVQQVMKLGQ